MSAFVMEPESIAAIISFYHMDTIFTEEGPQSLGFGPYLTDAGLDPLNSWLGLNKLFRLMYALNVKAVCARYPDKVTPDMYPIPEDMPIVDTPNEFQALKSIECYLYQCSEGNLDKTSKLYRVIEWTQHRLADAIIHRLPSYEAAEWG